MLLFAGLSAGAAWLIWFAATPIPLTTSPLDFGISSGSSLRSASQQMADAGLGFAPWQFTVLARFADKAAEIKAGAYEVEQGVTPWLLLKKLTRGDFTQAELTLVEGKTLRQFRAQIDAHPEIRHDSHGLGDKELLSHLGLNDSHGEGLFFPDTYLFAKNASDLEIFRRANKAMVAHLAREWEQRSPDSPCTSPYQALILASIIEKESCRAGDREQIAAVFANRLRQRMLLQTDPTVIYGLGDEYGGRLRKRDLLADTPYNTYTRGGLPPTPIAMPGLASLRAALHPAKSDMLYFVARGDGSSEFSRNLEGHNRAVARYQRGE